jgi:environmental stress-induced protein Ves
MKATHLRAGDFVAQRWRNGGGSTTQMAVHEHAGHWLWRLSVADVAESGPFSNFAGYRRILAVLDGGGMRLSVAGQPPVELRRGDAPFPFDGGARTHCTLLDGPVKDLNLMVQQGVGEATLEILEADAAVQRTLQSDWVLAFAIAGGFRAVIGDTDVWCGSGELLRIDDARGHGLTLQGRDGGARVALACIRAS